MEPSVVCALTAVIISLLDCNSFFVFIVVDDANRFMVVLCGAYEIVGSLGEKRMSEMNGPLLRHRRSETTRNRFQHAGSPVLFTIDWKVRFQSVSWTEIFTFYP